MCGIFGYIGTKSNAADTILNGLKTLEYRGYDSWGVAIKDADSIQIEKHIGKIGNATTTLAQSSVGIGHTRWATHGGVTDANAHPHTDCSGKLAVVHNGIVENFNELKSDLVYLGHNFVSQTDTEVIVHLLEEELKLTPNFVDAVKNTYLKLHGLNAIVALHTETKELVVVKNGSPVVIGQGTDGIYVASDITAIIPHTREIHFLEDHNMAVINGNVILHNVQSQQSREAEFQHIDWKIEHDELGSFPHFMVKEIHEQPRILASLSNYPAESLNQVIELIKNTPKISFIAAGTAYHACLMGIYWFAKIANRHVDSTIASEFDYVVSNFLDQDTLVLAASQSGETIDVIEPLNHAKARGIKIAALTNVLGSTLYRLADATILLEAGSEKAVASTKAYIAKLAMFLMLSYSQVGRQEEARQLLQKASIEIDRILIQQTEQLKNIAKELADKHDIYIIGRGVSYPSAVEAALKIKEVSYIHTEGLAGGELKHGTIALISKGVPCIVFAPNDETYQSVISNAIEIKSRGAMIIGISHKPNDVFDHYIEVKDLGDASVIAQIVPIQLLSYYLAVEKNLDPDKPRNLAKSVTVK